MGLKKDDPRTIQGSSSQPTIAILFFNCPLQRVQFKEREAGKANWALGASFITEGAIPFAAADPLRVIPSMMVGSAVAGALSMLFGATLAVPHGGIFVLPIPNAVGNLPMYILAIVVGSAVGGLMLTALKKKKA